MMTEVTQGTLVEALKCELAAELDRLNCELTESEKRELMQELGSKGKAEATE